MQNSTTATFEKNIEKRTQLGHDCDESILQKLDIYIYTKIIMSISEKKDKRTQLGHDVDANPSKVQ